MDYNNFTIILLKKRFFAFIDNCPMYIINFVSQTLPSHNHFLVEILPVIDNRNMYFYFGEFIH